MKRTLLYFLLVIVLAGLLGTVAVRDPGYVLLSYDGMTLQTSLWVFLGALFLTGFVVLGTLRAWRGIFLTTARLQQWQKDRTLSRSIDHTTKGLLLLQEGNLERAEKFLLSGAKNQPQPAVNYISLARVLDKKGDTEGRERYLRLAVEADATATAAAAVARAELLLERGEFAACLSALDDAPKSERTLRIRYSASLRDGNHEQLVSLLPKLKKILAPEEILKLETDLLQGTLNDSALTNEQKLAQYRSANETVKVQSEIIKTLSHQIADAKELEAIVRKAIKREWQPDLVEAYGALGGEELAQKRLKTALGWQKQHPLDASLSFAIGQLQEKLGQTIDAKAAYQKAVDQASHPGASERLAALYALDGDHQKSNELLQLAHRGA